MHGEPRLRGGNRPKCDQEQRSTGLPKSTNLMHPQPYSHVADPLGGEHGSNEEGGSRGIQPLAAADVSPSAAFMKSRMAFR